MRKEKESMMRRAVETIVILIGTIGWWGFVYPELCVTSGACEVTQEDADSKEADVTAAYPDVDDFLNGKEKLRIKFKAVEYLYQVKEKADSKKDWNND
ncbi:MAG: hypothetical protein ACI4ED_03125 [Suilimivivens sp.]